MEDENICAFLIPEERYSSSNYGPHECYLWRLRKHRDTSCRFSEMPPKGERHYFRTGDAKRKCLCFVKNDIARRTMLMVPLKRQFEVLGKAFKDI